MTDMGKGSAFMGMLGDYLVTVKAFLNGDKDGHFTERHRLDALNETTLFTERHEEFSRYAVKLAAACLAEIARREEAEKRAGKMKAGKAVVPEHTDFSKDGEFMKMYNAFARLNIRFWNGDKDGKRTDAYWDALIDEAHVFYDQFHNQFAMNLIFALMDELERREMDERAA